MNAMNRYTLLLAALAGTGFGVMYGYAGMGGIWSYLAAVNLALFTLYGLDKVAALRSWRRSPELLLHLGALAGGSPGALAGQRLFSHKTSKKSFQWRYWGIVLLQAVAITAWLELSGIRL